MVVVVEVAGAVVVGEVTTATFVEGAVVVPVVADPVTCVDVFA